MSCYYLREREVILNPITNIPTNCIYSNDYILPNNSLHPILYNLKHYGT